MPTYEGTFQAPNPPYIPQNTVRVCKGVCFEPSYSNTILWANANAQFAYIERQTARLFTKVTPFRIMDGQCYLPGPADYFMNCNYIAFTNADFGENRWWYAFITQVEFIDMYTTRISFDIDVIQTFMFEINLGSGTFVERAHAITDKPGDNLLPENLELGDYIVNDTARTELFDNYDIVVAATVDREGDNSVGGYYNGIYSGLEYLAFEDVSELKNFILDLTSSNKADAIIAIWMMPRQFVTGKGTESAKTTNYSYNAPERYRLDGYAPRNKKLLTYPFKFFTVSNLSGQSADYHYEYFGNNGESKIYSFLIVGDYSPTPTIKLVPQNYNGIGYIGTTDVSYGFDYGLTMSGFPQCAWVTDAYQAYLAQMGSVSAFGMNFNAVDLQMGQQVASSLTSLLSANVGGTVNSIFGIAQTMARQNAARSMPPQAGGQTANGAMVAMKAKDFLFTDKSLRADFAERLDNFFDMFGYQQNTIWSIGNISSSRYLNSRQNFNYIKTQNALVLGDANILPQYVEQIQGCFDNGIRFWHNELNYGNLKAPNDIVPWR